MQIRIFILIFILFQNIVRAQNTDVLDAIKNSQTYITKNKIHVLTAQNPGNGKIKCRFYFDTPLHLQKEQKGINIIAIKTMIFGTSEMPYDTLKKRLSQNKITLNVKHNYITLNASKNNLDSALFYLSKIICKPEYNSKKTDSIRKVIFKNSFPPGISPRLYTKQKTAEKLYGKNHPYGETYSESGLNSITNDDLKNYYENYLLNSKKYLIITGNIDFEETKALVNKYFSELKSPNFSQYKKYEKPTPPEHTKIYFHETLAKITGGKTYLNLLYPVNITFGSKDYYKIIVLNEILNSYNFGRLRKNINNKVKDVDYVYSNINNDIFSGNFDCSIVFKPENLADIIDIITNEHKKIINEPVFDTELEIAKEQVIKHFIKLQSKLNFSDLYAIEKYNLSKNYFSEFVDKIRKITVKDIQKTAKKYLLSDKYTIVVLGKHNELLNEFYKIAKKAEIISVKDEEETVLIPYGFCANNVAKKFLEVVKAHRNPSHQTLEIRGTYYFGHKENLITRIILRKNKKYKSTTNLITSPIKKILLNKEIYNGKTALLKNSQGETLSDTITKAIIKTNSYQFPDWEFFENSKLDIKLLGIFKLDTIEAYKIRVSYPYDIIRYNYYDTETGLKVRIDENKILYGEEVHDKTILISDYREVPGKKGELIAYKKTVISESFKAVFNVIKADFKTRIKNKDFNIDKYIIKQK